MLRKKMFGAGVHESFRIRSHEIFRIEALSDAVFAFSISLLVAALEVPQTFEELKLIISGALPFFATVAVLFIFWYQQNVFFRRYGLIDFRTILLNLLLLGIIVFYLYPLKFLFSVLLGSWTGLSLFPQAAEQGLLVLSNDEFPQLIILFSVGYLAIWLVIYLMHVHAASMAKHLGLNDYEVACTNKEKRGAIWNVLIAAGAIILALFEKVSFAGICYLCIPVLMLLNERLFRRKLTKTITKIQA
jgi:uncharacterized membrane protein